MLIEVENCIICDHRIQQQSAAVVTPFLAKWIWDRDPFPVRLAHCRRCGMQFFNPRITDDEAQILYAKYRGPEYQKQRESFEPWYTPRLNASMTTVESWTRRKQLLGAALASVPQFQRRFESVLDFGGDSGVLMETFHADRRFVFDISKAEPAPGVTSLSSLDECRAEHFDLILTSNVLEHVGFPRQFMSQLNSVASPDTLVLNEVPYESGTSFVTRVKRVAQYLILVAKRPALVRKLFGKGALTIMHEHVNYYSPSALRTLMECSGHEVLASGVYRMGRSRLSPAMTWTVSKLSS